MKEAAFFSLAVLLFGTQLAFGQIVQVQEDSVVTVHPDFSNPSHVNGLSPTLPVSPMHLNFQASPILKFDLTGFPGQIVTDDVDLDFVVQGTHPNYNSHRFIGMHRVLVPWNEATLTWNTFGPSPGLNEGVDYETVPMFILPDLIGAVSGTVVTFPIQKEIVQSWIDQPSQNHGVIIISREGFSHTDIAFHSKEASNGLSPFISLQLEPRLGDVNCDGFVDLLDVSPFVQTLASGSFDDKADINRDGIVNLLDVAPFVNLLTLP